MQSHLLPGAAFPRAPVAPVVPPPTLPSASLRSSRKVRASPTLACPEDDAPTGALTGAAEVTTSFAFPVPRTSGTSADHASPCSRGYSRCGIAGRGKRPIS